MAHIRYFRPDSLYEVVVRTIEGLALFRPVLALTRAVLGVIGRALRLFDVRVYAFTYLSNHKHLMLSATHGDELAGFMCHVNSNTALVAKSVTGWRRSVWGRYRPIPILDDHASIRRLRYVLANGVKEGLVESPLDWPGPSSTHALLTETPIDAQWVVRVPGHLKSESTIVEQVPIELTPLPCWAGLSPQDRKARVAGLIADITEEGLRDRRGRPPLGVAGILGQDPFTPIPLDKEPPPRAHASKQADVDRFVADEEEFNAAYRRSVEARRKAERDRQLFPIGSFPPAAPFVRGR